MVVCNGRGLRRYTRACFLPGKQWLGSSIATFEERRRQSEMFRLRWGSQSSFQRPAFQPIKAIGPSVTTPFLSNPIEFLVFRFHDMHPRGIGVSATPTKAIDYVCKFIC